MKWNKQIKLGCIRQKQHKNYDKKDSQKQPENYDKKEGQKGKSTDF